ncbi:MAG: PilZ domain-containing protein [Caenibius sp.]
MSDQNEVLLQAKIRLHSGKIMEIGVFDLSEGGCMIDRQSMRLTTDQRVLIKFSGFDYLAAYVRWVEDERAGLQFEHPIHEAVLDHIKATHC